MASLTIKPVTIVCGNYGAGKTEFCINFALYLRRSFGKMVSIADYDIINPYFRSREKAEFLKRSGGIDILGNVTDNMTGTDLPAFAANIHGPLLRGEFLVIDLAGSKNGLKPLAFIRDSLYDNFEFLCVLNAFRPGTKTVKGMVDTVRLMESYSGYKVSGIVHNSHLVRETTAETALYGQDLTAEASKILNIPISYTQIKEDIYNEIKDKLLGEPIIFEELAMRDEWL